MILWQGNSMENYLVSIETNRDIALGIQNLRSNKIIKFKLPFDNWFILVQSSYSFKVAVDKSFGEIIKQCQILKHCIEW